MGYFNAEQVYWSHLKFPTANPMCVSTMNHLFSPKR